MKKVILVAVFHKQSILILKTKSVVVQEVEPNLYGTVLDMMDPLSLPPGWIALRDVETNRILYHHKDVAQARSEHPSIAYYRCAVFVSMIQFYRQVYSRIVWSDRH